MLVPIAGFIIWAWALLDLLAIWKLDIHSVVQVVAPHFLAGYFLQAFAWAFAGPQVAAVLAALMTLLSIYAGLNTREPALFLQVILNGALFVGVVSYLHAIQKRNNEKWITLEKLTEDIHLKQEERESEIALERALRTKIVRFRELQSFADKLKGYLGLQAAVKRFMEEIMIFVPECERCVIHLVDEERQELKFVMSHDRTGPGVEGGEPTVYDRWAMRRCQSLVVDDVRNDFRFPMDASVTHEYASLCAIPLLTERKVLGVVCLSSGQKAAFTADDLRILDILSSLTAAVLRNILLYEKITYLAMHDSLTGLYVKRHFEQHLSSDLKHAKSSGSKLSVILMDIDFFKHYNDEYGHAAGDLVLKNIGGVMMRKLKNGIIAARYGGEEFVLLLPNAGKKEAVEFAETIRKEIEHTKFLLRRNERRVTASLGVATYPEDGDEADKLVAHADRSLYAAKNAGRNRVWSQATR